MPLNKETKPRPLNRQDDLTTTIEDTTNTNLQTWKTCFFL